MSPLRENILTDTSSGNKPLNQTIRLHYKEVLSLINLIEEFVKNDESGKPDFSQLNPIELRAYSRLGEMKKAQETYFQSRGLPIPSLRDSDIKD